MATITLKYDARNPVAKKTLNYILSIGFNEVKPQKTGLEEAFEDIEAGRVTRIYTPPRSSAFVMPTCSEITA